jgi:hypothetical protein
MRKRKKFAMVILLAYILGTVWMIPLVIPDEVRLQDPTTTVLKKYPP